MASVHLEPVFFVFSPPYGPRSNEASAMDAEETNETPSVVLCSAPHCYPAMQRDAQARVLF